MVFTKRLFGLLALAALALPFAGRAYADTTNYSGTLAADNGVFTVAFSTVTAQNYTFATTSFASGGFVPVLTLFSNTGGNPLAFGENDTNDVSFKTTLGPGSYILALSEDPNVFTTNFAAGPLFASSPTITGDLCGVAGGTFLNVFDNCSQRTSSFAASISSTAVTPEPSTWLLVMPPVVLLFVAKYRQSA